MHPQTVLLVASGVASLALTALVALLPVPYAVLAPGPVFNTLGTYGDVALITVEGHPTYPTSGQLDLTTVQVSGGPNSSVSLLAALRAWLSPDRLVVPVEEQFPPGQTAEEEEEQNEALMVSSQESATAAALSELDIPYTTTLRIDGTEQGSPAEKVLRKGDVILAVDGQVSTDLTVLRDQLQRVEPGDGVTVTVRRGGRPVDVEVETIEGEGRTLLGVMIDPVFDFPFDVKITIDNVGGPSAGTMFALGIIDTLTPGEMTGGEQIAGTGTMEVDGTVGSIGGILQKMAGARRAGARWFLVPEGNCPEVVGHVPDEMRVVKVGTLEEARDAVEAIASREEVGGAAAALPTCT
jgi:PDZ domain-containing protein